MSPLPLWREADPEVFRGTIVAAAEHLDVLPLAVEKDYWICQTLHSIVTTHPGEVVFKGGTSLEKLGIIRWKRRFVSSVGLPQSAARAPRRTYSDR